MDIGSLDIIGIVTNPLGIVTTLVSGVLFFQVYKVIDKILKPVQYIEKLYEMADMIIINLDNKLIDKIRSKKMKSHIQKQIKDVLLRRKLKLDDLISRISD